MAFHCTKDSYSKYGERLYLGIQLQGNGFILKKDKFI